MGELPINSIPNNDDANLAKHPSHRCKEVRASLSPLDVPAGTADRPKRTTGRGRRKTV